MSAKKDKIVARPQIYTRANEVFGRFIQISLRADGSITGFENRGHALLDSIIRNLEAEGNIRAFFDLSPYPSLDKIPVLSDPACIHPDPLQNRVFAAFFNSRDFSREEYPELFYTTLPTSVLSICRTAVDAYCGILRTMPTIPEIYLERSNGIIFVDEQERLIGFNHTFHEFFEERYRAPDRMLKVKVSEFLNPTPAQIQEEKLAFYNPAEGPALETAFTLDNGGLEFSKPGYDRLSGKELQLDNDSEGNLYCRLPVRLNTQLDFQLDIEARLKKEGLPIITLGKQGSISDFPDRFGYLLGYSPERGRFMLKRKGLIAVLGGKVRPEAKVSLTLRKTGNTLRLSSSGREVLAFYDSNFLHTEEGMLTFGLRAGSACLFTRAVLRCARENPRLEDTPKVIKLNTPEQHYFTLNRLNIMHLSINYPHISAYVLENVTEIQKQVNVLENRFQATQSDAVPQDNPFVGQSPLMETIRQKAGLVAESDATVLIEGATGTGKEVLARYIHEKSRRKEKPLIKADLSTLPRDLVESELFGHEKGAFTGAYERKIGLFEQADQGTLFLDEVANLTLDVQKKLLQFLQDRRIVRIGGEKPIPLNVRIIVAANTPLATLVEKGLFRADLFYRIDVVSIYLPPLKERREDIPELVQLFLREMNRKHGRSVQGLLQSALAKILSYPWLGNIRELKNTVERAVIFGKGEKIGLEHLRLSGPQEGDIVSARKAHRFIRVGKEEVRELFEKHRGMARKVAEELGIAPRTLYYQLKRMGCPVETVRGSRPKG